MEKKLEEIRKELREIKKQNKEKDLHIKFLTERLENWADKNFILRQEIVKKVPKPLPVPNR